MKHCLACKSQGRNDGDLFCNYCYEFFSDRYDTIDYEELLSCFEEEYGSNSLIVRRDG